MIRILCRSFSLCVVFSSVIAIFAGFIIGVYYFVEKIIRNVGCISFLSMFLSLNATFMPMHILGLWECLEEYRLS
jgi:heme/copper-type cytochrome/quinol oxidase subunit 1